MPALANSLTVRIAGVLLVLGVLFNILMAIALFAPIGRERSELRLFPLPAQAAAIVDVLDAADPQQRPRVLDAVNSSFVSVRIVEAPPGGVGASRAVMSRTIRAVMTRYDHAFANRDIHVDVRRKRLLERLASQSRQEAWAPTRLYVRLHDGSWALIEPARSAFFDRLLTRGVAVISIAGIFVVFALWLALRQTARPVAMLAANARDFADRLDAPDMPEIGPKDLQGLARAFNQMKARIRVLVTDRTRILAAVAHDLRTYLTRLRLRAEFISDPDQRTRAERDIDEMADLIEDTLAFARNDAHGASVRCDVGTELAAFVEARTEMGEPVHLVREAVGVVEIMLAPLSFRRVLANLTDNAIRYGGSAEIHVDATAQDVVIAVADDGPGIPADALNRVTAPFERLEPSRGRRDGGSGLGLAIVKSIVEGAGGVLSLANRPEGGLRVELRLPRAAPAL
jgi:two-component system, OmpR family, osmolarity sensor histidine kinase EnvZ